MNLVRYQAPAKVIFSGEHAVVFGKPALVSSINKHLTVTLYDSTGKEPVHSDVLFASQAVLDYLKKKNVSIKKTNFFAEIKSEIPIGRGLGSSAGFSVALTAAFLEFFSGVSFIAKKEEINNIAHQIEKRFHSRPSGVDTSTSCFGGFVWYRKEFEFLKTISNLHLKIPKHIEDRLVLVDSGKPNELTAEMVEFVGKEYNKSPKRMDTLFSEIEKTTKRMMVSLMKEDGSFFAQTIQDNELLLEKIGIVSVQTKLLLKKLSSFGIGKVTGAGGKKKGSGYILFYQSGPPGFSEYLNKMEIPYIKFKSEYEGVKRL